MRSRLLLLAALLLAASTLPAQSPPPAPAASPQPSAAPAPANLLWTEGGKDSELTTVDGVEILVLHGRDAEVAVHLADVQDYAIRAGVDILNRAQSEVTVEGRTAKLEILKPKHKTFSPLDPEKLANNIKKRADVDASERAGTGCPYLGTGCGQNASGVASSKEVQQVADAIVNDIRSTAWQVRTLKPQEQSHGAIFFPYEHRRDECLFSIQVGGELFEFPACRRSAKKK